MQRHVEAERLRGLQVNDELDFARLLNGQIARVGALQNLVNVEGRAPQTIRNIDAVAHERSIHRPFPRPSMTGHRRAAASLRMRCRSETRTALAMTTRACAPPSARREIAASISAGRATSS